MCIETQSVCVYFDVTSLPTFIAPKTLADYYYFNDTNTYDNYNLNDTDNGNYTQNNRNNSSTIQILSM